jgi:hypothetical protein
VIAYVDSSVVARFVLRQPDRLVELTTFDQRFTSQLTQLECLRAVDKVRMDDGLASDEVFARTLALYQLLRGMRRVAVSRAVLERGSASFPLPAKSLDAVHLGTALHLRERTYPQMTFATHDRQQARLALLLGFPVIGI